MSNKRTAFLKMTDDVKKSLGTPFKVKKEKNLLLAWIADEEYKVAELQNKVEELKKEDTLDVEKIIDKTDELELEQRKLSQGQSLLKELFEDKYLPTEETED